MIVEPVVGRAGEIAALRALVDRMPQGGALALTGEPGIGKSTLLQVVASRAEQAGAAVIQLGADDATATSHLGLFSGLFRGVVKATARSTLLTAGAALERVLGVLDVERRPVLLVADDLQWADSTSLLTLAAVVRRATPHGLVTVVATRPQLADGMPAVLDAIVAVGGLDLVLAPLTKAEVVRLIQVRTGSAPSRALRTEVERAGGNPFYALALAESFGSDSAAGSERIRLPGDQIDRVLVRHVQRLGESTFDVLQRAAVLGRTCSLDDLAEFIGDRGVVVDAVSRAGTAGLVESIGDTIAFRHDLMVEALERTLPAAVRRALHRRAFDLLLAQGADARLAKHLLALDLAAEPSGVDCDLVLDVARAAAPSTALELCTALETGGAMTLDQQAAAMTVRMQALLSGGQIAEAERIAREIRAQPGTAVLHHEALGTLMRAEFLQGRAGDFLSEYGDDPLDGATISPARYRAEMALASLFGGDLRRAGTLAQRAVVDAASEQRHGSVGDDPTTASTIAHMVLGHLAATALDLEGAESHLSAACTIADRVPDAGFAGPLLFRAATEVGWRQPDRALRSVEADERCDDSGTAARAPFRHGIRAQALYALGSWDHALAECDAGRILIDELGGVAGSVLLDGLRGLILGGRGEPVDSDALLAAASVQGPGADVAIAAAARAALLSGAPDVSAALWGLLAAALDRSDQRAMLVAYAPDIVRIRLAVGDRSDAIALTEQIGVWSDRAPFVAEQGAWCAALIAGDTVRLTALADSLAGRGLIVDAAAAAHDAVEAGDAAAGRRAEHWYRTIGASALAARLPGIVFPPAEGDRQRFGWEAVTAGERAVLRLLADGMSNMAIAQTLHVSRRTVESHLAHVYTKTGITSRLVLGQQAAERNRAGVL